jgi:hypothetical protein
MWYEIIPSFAIVTACLLVPPYAMCGINYLLLNGKTRARKWTEHPQDFHVYLRDRRLTGSEYKPKGLEAIPDASQ